VRNPITREEFAKQVADALRAEGVEGEFEHEAIENRLVHPARPPFLLEEHFLEAQGQPPHLLEQLVRAYAHLHLHPPSQPETWEEAKDVVFPYVRPLLFHALLGFRAQQGEKVDPVPYASMTEHVTVCVGTPTKSKTLVASVADLARWGVSLEEAIDAGRANVRRRGTQAWPGAKDYPGVLRSPWKDEYGIARILFPDFYPTPLRGDPVLIAPTWQHLFVAGSDDEKGLASLGALGRKIAEGDTVLLFRPMRLHDGALEHWLPPRGHPAHVALKTLHLINECGDYADQATAGRRYLERREEASNIPVPQVALFNGGVEANSFAVWREGPSCALPKVDLVVFKRKFQDLGVAKWDDVARVLGGELEPLDVYPPRFRARTFPAEWQLAQMNLKPWGPGPG
jgi:hypothetical protein